MTNHSAPTTMKPPNQSSNPKVSPIVAAVVAFVNSDLDWRNAASKLYVPLAHSNPVVNSIAMIIQYAR